MVAPQHDHVIAQGALQQAVHNGAAAQQRDADLHRRAMARGCGWLGVGAHSNSALLRTDQPRKAQASRAAVPKAEAQRLCSLQPTTLGRALNREPSALRVLNLAHKRTCVRHRLGDQAPSAAGSSSAYPSSSHSWFRALPPILHPSERIGTCGEGICFETQTAPLFQPQLVPWALPSILQTVGGNRMQSSESSLPYWPEQFHVQHSHQPMLPPRATDRGMATTGMHTRPALLFSGSSTQR